MQRMRWVVLGALLMQGTAFCQDAIPQSAKTSTPKPAFCFGQGLIVEYGRTIAILQRGIDENWTREQYLKAFDPPKHPRAGEDLGFRAAIRQAIEWRMPEPEIWDEKPPISVQAARLMEDYSRQRELLIQAQDVPARRKRDPANSTPCVNSSNLNAFHGVDLSTSPVPSPAQLSPFSDQK